MRTRVKKVTQTTDTRERKFLFEVDVDGQPGKLISKFFYKGGEWLLNGESYTTYSQAELKELLKIVEKLNRE